MKQASSRLAGVLFVFVVLGAAFHPAVWGADVLPDIVLSEASKAAISPVDLNRLEELRAAMYTWNKGYYSDTRQAALGVAHSQAKKIRYPKECQELASDMLQNFLKFKFHAYVAGNETKAQSYRRMVTREFSVIFKAMTGKPFVVN